MPVLAFILTLILASVSSLAMAAKPRTFIDEAEPVGPSSIQEGKMWAEGKVNLPPWPKDSDLVEFELDAPSPSKFRYFIDGQHLSVGSDDVVRYTLVAKSPTGAQNVTYEGLRCTPKGVFRVYAYGSGNRFTPVEGEEWQPVTATSGDKLHGELHGHFLCGPLTFAPRPLKDMIRALKGQIRGRENSGFLPD